MREQHIQRRPLVDPAFVRDVGEPSVFGRTEREYPRGTP